MIDFWKELERRDKAALPDNVAFHVETRELKAALARLAHGFRRDRTCPIRNCVKMEFYAKAGRMKLTVDSAELCLDTGIPAFGEADQAVCFPFQALKRFIGLVRGPLTGFRQETEKGWAVLSGTASMRARTAAIQEFPEAMKMTGETGLVIEETEVGQFCGDLQRAARFISDSDFRRVLSGVLVEWQDSRLNLIATDGKRLFWAKRAAAAQEFPKFILPGRAAMLAAKLFAKSRRTIKIHAGEFAEITDGETRLTARIITGEFPNYRQVVPTGFSNEATFSAFVLKWGIDCITGGASCQVSLEIVPGALRLTNRSEEFGYLMENEVPAVTTDADPGQSILFRSDFLTAATAIGEHVTMRWRDGYSPVTIATDEYMYVVMPLRTR